MQLTWVLFGAEWVHRQGARCLPYSSRYVVRGGCVIAGQCEADSLTPGATTEKVIGTGVGHESCTIGFEVNTRDRVAEAVGEYPRAVEEHGGIVFGQLSDLLGRLAP